MALRDKYLHEFHHQHSTLIQSILCDTRDECLRKFDEHHERSTELTIEALEKTVGAKEE